MATRTSKLKALTNLQSWQLEAVDVIFGEVRVRPERSSVLAGELVRDTNTGQVLIFLWREDENLALQPHYRGRR